MADRDHSAGKRADPASYSPVTSWPALHPNTAGIPTRLAISRLRQMGIALSPLLRKARLSEQGAALLDQVDGAAGVEQAPATSHQRALDRHAPAAGESRLMMTALRPL